MLHRTAPVAPSRFPVPAGGPAQGAVRVRRPDGRLDVAAFLDEMARADADDALDALAWWRAEGTLRRLRRAGHTGAELQRMTRALLTACRRHALLD